MKGWKDYRLPPTFAADHLARELPERGIHLVISRTTKAHLCRLDLDGFYELLSDAEHYADAGNGWDGTGMQGLISSARATARELRHLGPPEGRACMGPTHPYRLLLDKR